MAPHLRRGSFNWFLRLENDRKGAAPSAAPFLSFTNLVRLLDKRNHQFADFAVTHLEFMFEEERIWQGSFIKFSIRLSGYYRRLSGFFYLRDGVAHFGGEDVVIC